MKLELVVKKEFDVSSIVVDAGVRYFEDNEVNGYDDNDIDEYPELEPRLPLCYKDEKGKWRWKFEINLEEGEDFGKIKNWPEGTTARIHSKTCDDNEFTVLGKDGNVIAEGCAYVPSFIGEMGDYIVIDIDENGRIEDFICDADLVQKLIDSFF